MNFMVSKLKNSAVSHLKIGDFNSFQVSWENMNGLTTNTNTMFNKK